MGSLILAALGALVLHLIACEFYERASSIAEWLIQSAVQKLDQPTRIRYEEEWLAHLDQCTGNLQKLLHSVGCFACSWKLRQVAPKKLNPTARDTMMFDFDGKEVAISIATATAFLKVLRDSSGKRDLDKVIRDFETYYVIGPPDADELRMLGTLMTEVATSAEQKQKGTRLKIEKLAQE